MSDIILYAVLGLGAGTAYALLGLGAVAIYKGSGVINFAQGAIGMIAAIVMTRLAATGIPLALAVLLAVTCSGAIGAIMYLLVMRPLRSAPALARNVATLGLMVVLLASVPLVFGNVTSSAVPGFLPAEGVTVGDITFGLDRAFLVLIAIGATLLLTLLYRATRFGLSTRAVAENELGASLLGFSPTSIGAANWVIGSVLAGLAGILISPITGIDPTTLTYLVVPALAVALVGGFSSFWVTLAAGLALGIAQSETRLLGDSFAGISDVLPFVLIVIVMVLRSKPLPSRGALLQGRPPIAMNGRVRWWYVVASLAALIALTFVLQDQYIFAIQTSLCFGIILLSQTIVTGYAGQISLAQLTFAGIGVLLTAAFSTTLGLPFPLPIILAAIVAFPLGAIVGLPAVRVRGVNLAVLTLALSAAAYTFVFGQEAWTGGAGLSYVQTPSLFGLDLDAVVYPGRYVLVTFLLLVLATVATRAIRRSRLGRQFLAVRENERAAAASGINVSRTKLLAFSIAASMAAVGGSLIAYQLSTVTYDGFQASSSVALLSASYIFGVGSILGAIVAGFIAPGGVLNTVLADAFSPSVTVWVTFVMGILLILTVVTNPDGAVPYIAGRLRARRPRAGASKHQAETPTIDHPAPSDTILDPLAREPALTGSDQRRQNQ